MTKLPAIASLWAVCLLSAMSCTSPADSHRREQHPPTAASHDAPNPEAPAIAKNASKWPRIDTAQRLFSGEEMFVEKTSTGHVAWVLSMPGSSSAQALDFFGGRTIPIKPSFYPDGRSKSEFRDANGKLHRITTDEDYRFNGPAPGGTVIVGDILDGDFIDLSSESIWFHSPELNFHCVFGLDVTSRFKEAKSNRVVIWRKIPLYREVPSKACPHGAFQSLIGTALDLRDGTILVTTTTSLVFRLNKHDLSPAGDAPGLRIVDAEKIEALARDAEQQKPQDREQYVYSKLEAIMSSSDNMDAKK
jgi:hypothetical protein